ncbi:MAG: Mur ligase family protein [Thermoguttaceae bacterium]
MRACCKDNQPISLKNTLRSVCKKIHTSFASDVKAVSCCTDADLVRPGDVYFATVSEDEIEESVGLAIYRGCSAVVAERPVSGNTIVPFFIIPNVAEGFAACCHAIYDDPAKSLKVIGITGTSGKTSTSYLVSGVLAEAGYQVGLIGSLGVFDGLLFHAGVATDLSPDRLAFWLARMVMNGCTHVILEISSLDIASGFLAGIQLDVVCLTNIRRDHIDLHQSVEQYRRTKLSIFKYAKKKALAICNADDRISEAIVPLIDLPLLSVGIRNRSEVNGVLVERFQSEQTFIISAGTEAAPIRTKIIGDEHLYNCMMATALGIGFDIDLKTIIRGMERVETIPGRMERLECGQPFAVYIDSARTSDSLAASLRTLRDVTHGRLLCVFGAAGYHESTRRSHIGKMLETLTDVVLLTAVSDPMNQDAAAAICDIGKGFSNQTSAKVMPNRAEAIAWALSEAKETDTVLIVGHGESESADASPNIRRFCDRLFTKQWLHENQLCEL